MNICLTTPPTQSSHGVAHICAIGGVVVPDASVEIWLGVKVWSCRGITSLKKNNNMSKSINIYYTKLLIQSQKTFDVPFLTKYIQFLLIMEKLGNPLTCRLLYS